LFFEDLVHRLLDESRHTRPKTHVLDAKMQQSQENGHRLLLIPGENEGKREAIDIGVQCLSQSESNLNGRIGVVTLANVKKAWNAINHAKLEFVEAVLATG